MITQLRMPVLALFAQNDRQIDPIQGAAAYRRLLADSDDDRSEVVIVPNADHNMALSPRGCMQDQRDGYRDIGGMTLSPVFLESVAGWMRTGRTLDTPRRTTNAWSEIKQSVTPRSSYRPFR
jgi:hypothetical protein